MAKRKKRKTRAVKRRRKVAKRSTAARRVASAALTGTRRHGRSLVATREGATPTVTVERPPLRKVVLQTRTPVGPEYRRFCAMALKLPGVETSTSYGTPSLKVKGRILARFRSEAEGALVLRCSLIDQQILLQADPNVFFITDHYVGYPMILVRLNLIRRGALKDLLVRAWRQVAPAKLVAAYDAAAER